MDGLMFNDAKEAMGFYVTGMGLVKSIWHQSFTGVEVREAPTILPEMVPGRILAPITVVAPIDPVTFDPVEGLGLIKLAGVRQRLGHAGGRKRVNWTPCQPADVYATIDRFRAVGATVEGMMWLEPGRFLVEGKLPDPDPETFGADAHDVRFCAIANYTGQGTDVIIVSLTRVVCANTERVALYSANKGGNVLKIRHAADVADRWDVDVSAFLADYSAKIREHGESKRALAARSLGATSDAIIAERDAYFRAVIGSDVEPDGKAGTLYRRKLAALKAAWHAERENARKVGIDPDSRRVAYEAVTNVLSHGGMVDVGSKDGPEWRPVLNSGRTDAARAMALVSGDASSRALALALA